MPEDGFIVTDVGWNKNGVAQQFPITVPGTFITPSGLATMGFGPAAVLGVKMAHPEPRGRVARRRRRLQRQSVGGRDGDGSRAAGRLAGDGQRRRSARSPGLESMHYGWSFGCLFERRGQPYRADYAAMARSFGARGVTIESADELGPALREALQSDLPTVIQAPMENAPTPTPGHWDINDVYRPGRLTGGGIFARSGAVARDP